MPARWDRRCGADSWHADCGPVVIFIVMSSGSPTSQLFVPAFPRLYTRCGVRRAAPCEGQSHEGTPNKFCASQPRLRCRGGTARRGRTPRTTLPLIPFAAAILAGGRWLAGVWPVRPPGPFCSPPYRASTMRGAGPRRVGRPGPGPLPPALSTPPPLGARPTCRPARRSLLAPRWPSAGGPRRRGSRISSPDIRRHTVPTPLPFQTAPVSASARTEF